MPPTPPRATAGIDRNVAVSKLGGSNVAVSKLGGSNVAGSNVAGSGP